jgi:hypothetical protein
MIIKSQFSGVVFEDKAVTTASNQELECAFSGLSQDSKVTWIGPDNNEISDSDNSNYVIDQGIEFLGNKVSTLTITTAKLASLSSGVVFKCKLKSAKYPVDSPEVVKEMTLTILTFGKFEAVMNLPTYEKVNSSQLLYKNKISM